jgi:hypothetical protein
MRWQIFVCNVFLELSRPTPVTLSHFCTELQGQKSLSGPPGGTVGAIIKIGETLSVERTKWNDPPFRTQMRCKCSRKSGFHFVHFRSTLRARHSGGCRKCHGTSSAHAAGDSTAAPPRRTPNPHRQAAYIRTDGFQDCSGQVWVTPCMSHQAAIPVMISRTQEKEISRSV